MLIARRKFLLGLLALTAFSFAPGFALADQGSGGSGSSGSGSTGSGSSGGDDEDDNNDNDNDDDNDDNGGGGDDKKIDQDDIRDAVDSGEAMSLRKAIKRAKDQTDGRIIDVNLVRKSNKLIYVFTIVESSGRVEKLRMDAVSGRFAGMLGF